MLRHGASLTEIGEVLRHRNPQTTTIYAKVSVELNRHFGMLRDQICGVTAAGAVRRAG
jgi:DNA-binding transcriptional MerR regulator